MKTYKKNNRIDLDAVGTTFAVVVWGGLLLSVFTQVL